jgi:uncharacterized membrane protein YhaH (DUF805 family)
MRYIHLWLSLSSRVNRRDYLVSGVGLMTFKYVIEAMLLWSISGEWLTPIRFLDPVLFHRAQWFTQAQPWLPWVVVIGTLPFIWIGLSLSIRRSLDAGGGGWSGLFFLVPFLNFVAMITLAVLPSAQRVITARPVQADATERNIAGNLLAFLAAQVVAGVMMVFCVFALGSYGSSLFVATPVLMGVIHAMVLSSRLPVSRGKTMSLGQIALIGSLLIMLLFALEGIICLLMAWPLAAILMAFGSLIGHQLAGFFRPSPGIARWVPVLFCALIPLVAWQESRQVDLEILEVSTAIEVNAPPATVWDRVVSFPDLPAPDGIFSTGIACPLRASIEGTGVGAIRRCEFTTGAFVEPITVWDQPKRLAFDVTSQPPAMRELTPFTIQPPHLDGYLLSKRGEFRLVAIDGGHRTRLEGSTWYELKVYPSVYWRRWSDGIISAIHHRVLSHIRTLAEADIRE